MELAISVAGDDGTQAPGGGRALPRPVTTESVLHGGASRSRAHDSPSARHRQSFPPFEAHSWERKQGKLFFLVSSQLIPLCEEGENNFTVKLF
jgi:hypothetical protein